MTNGAMVVHGVLVDDDPRDQQISALREEVTDLRHALAEARASAARAQRDMQHAIAALRKQLTPLHLALKAVFGELDGAGLGSTEADTGSSANGRTAAIWDSWKSKFPGKPAQIIDALLLHGQMTQSQIAIAIRSDRRNVPPMIFKLNKAGLLQKNGGVFSLKAL